MNKPIPRKVIITTVTKYVTPDNTEHATYEEANRHAYRSVARNHIISKIQPNTGDYQQAYDIAETILDNWDDIKELVEG